MTDRGDSTSLGQDDATVVAHSSDSMPSTRGPRSTSPGKRKVSEMEREDASEAVEPMEVDQESIATASISMAQEGDSQATILLSPTSSHQIHQASSTESTASGTTPHSAEDSTTTNSASTNATSSSLAVSNGDIDDHNAGKPSVDEQVQIVFRELMKDLQDGQMGFVVSTAWLQRVLARSSEAKNHGPYDKSVLEGDIGPVDNSHTLPEGPIDKDLRDEQGYQYIPLKKGLRYDDDFQIIPSDTFAKIQGWYGIAPGQQVIRRYSHDTTPEGAATQQVQWEIYPPIFTLRKLASDSISDISKRVADQKTAAPRVVASRNENVQSFLKRVKERLDIPMDTKVRVWRIIEIQQAISTVEVEQSGNSMLSPPASREPSPIRLAPAKLSIELQEFNGLSEGTQKECVDVKDQTMNDKYNGKSKIETYGLAADQVLIIEPQSSKMGDTFASDATRKNKFLAPKGDGTGSQATSGRSSPAPYGVMTRGRLRGQGRARGTVGLQNLGNTCYMNSALQCVRSVEELTLYFLEGMYKKELNPNNPLGHNGQIAKAYAGLVSSIYTEGMHSFSPKNFKQTLGKYGPMFSGYGQQDSQEFMSFLIDGLHEDLNRIHKKPYIENPESDDNTVNDPEAIRALGKKFRENFQARNDSVAMDLFNGFYKNTMVCPVCEKVSITFDPFSLITLQLPIEQTWQHTIEFFPLDGRPVKVDIDMDKMSTLRALKEFVAARIPGTKATKMMFSEVFSHKFYRTMDDKQTISEANIQPKDDMVLYELEDVPTNWPAPKKKKIKIRSMLSFGGNDSEDDIPTSDSPMADKMLVPIFHRVAKRNSAYGKEVELWPSYTIITRDEAKSMYEILRKVLGRVATMTTRPFLTEDEPSEQEHDAVVTTEEDAASNIDGNVNAQSIQSEDDMVDVSMNESVSTAQPKQIPAILEPDTEIPEHFRNLFELKYLPAGQEMVPTGWNSLDANKNYPTLKSRIPARVIQPPPAQSSDVSSNQSPTATPGTSDMEDEPEFSNAHPSVEPQSDHDSDLPSLEETWDQQKPGSSLGARKYGKNKRAVKNTYGKNNRQQSRIISRNAISDTDESEEESNQDGDAALIRLGEAIILDWDRGAYDALFGGTSANDMRGHDTRVDSEPLPDPELEKKRQKRAARKKSGVTLEECFTESAKAEILTEGNDWYCNRCKELRLASKKLEIWTAPDILVIHLKRFSQNRVFRDKVDVLVDFPVEGLDLSGKVGETEGKDIIYDLIAVDNHYGGLGGGHYTAYAKNFFDNKWYEYNGKSTPYPKIVHSLLTQITDSQVTQRNPNSVVTSAAYLLFYRRRSSTPLGPPYLQELVQSTWVEPSEDTEPTSNSSSRATSPSGQGKARGLDDSSPSGSSSAFRTAAAGATAQRGASAAKGPLRTISDEEMLPRYEDVEDEGISMEEGLSRPLFGPALPPRDGQLRHATIPGLDTVQWNWARDFAPVGQLGQRDLYADDDVDADADIDDAASNEAAGGNFSDGESGQERLLQDFGDEYAGSSTLRFGNSPSPTRMEEGFMADEGIGVDHMMAGDEDAEDVLPVAEVRVDESSESGHMKMD